MKVSAIIPTYNTAQYILRAVQSCLDLTGIYEVIVINDGSTDETSKLLSRIQDPKLRLLKHSDELNHGRSASRNLGINAAQGDWIIFCDADDFCLPHRLTHLLDRNHENIDGYYDLIDARTDNPDLIENDILQHQGIERKVSSEALFNYLVSNREAWFNLTALTIRKSSLLRGGLFDESLAIAEDTDLIWRLALTSNLINGASKSAVAVRWVHLDNSYQDETNLLIGRYAFYKKWKNLIAELPLSKEARRRIIDSHRFYRKKYMQLKVLNWFDKK